MFAAVVYGYSQWLRFVYGSESRCCEDKRPTCEYICIIKNISVDFATIQRYRRFDSAL